MDRLRFKGQFINKKQDNKCLKAIECGKNFLKLNEEVREVAKKCIESKECVYDLKIIRDSLMYLLKCHLKGGSKSAQERRFISQFVFVTS
ncbi:hypothetical protein ACS0PU_010111 [Formica fusca]